MHYLTTATCIKDEKKFIDEFLRLHLGNDRFNGKNVSGGLGVEHAILLDRGPDKLVERFRGHPHITAIAFPEPKRHAEGWNFIVKNFINFSRWIAFIDCDQVLFPTQTNDLKVFLQDYEDINFLTLNWHTFGSNNLEKEPENISTYEAYTKRALGNILPNNSINDHVQTIANPKVLKQITWNDPHAATAIVPHKQYNEHKTIVNPPGPFNRPATQDKAFIAHYYTRSKEYYLHKVNKLRCDTGTKAESTAGVNADFDHHQTYLNEVEDTRIKEFWEKYCK